MPNPWAFNISCFSDFLFWLKPGYLVKLFLNKCSINQWSLLFCIRLMDIQWTSVLEKTTFLKKSKFNQKTSKNLIRAPPIRFLNLSIVKMFVNNLIWEVYDRKIMKHYFPYEIFLDRNIQQQTSNSNSLPKQSKKIAHFLKFRKKSLFQFFVSQPDDGNFSISKPHGYLTKLTIF